MSKRLPATRYNDPGDTIGHDDVPLYRYGHRSARNGIRDELVTITCEPRDRDEEHARTNLPGIGRYAGDLMLGCVDCGQSGYSEELMESHRYKSPAIILPVHSRTEVLRLASLAQATRLAKILRVEDRERAA